MSFLKMQLNFLNNKHLYLCACPELVEGFSVPSVALKNPG